MLNEWVKLKWCEDEMDWDKLKCCRCYTTAATIETNWYLRCWADDGIKRREWENNIKFVKIEIIFDIWVRNVFEFKVKKIWKLNRIILHVEVLGYIRIAIQLIIYLKCCLTIRLFTKLKQNQKDDDDDDVYELLGLASY